MSRFESGASRPGKTLLQNPARPESSISYSTSLVVSRRALLLCSRASSSSARACPKQPNDGALRSFVEEARELCVLRCGAPPWSSVSTPGSNGQTPGRFSGCSKDSAYVDSHRSGSITLSSSGVLGYRIIRPQCGNLHSLLAGLNHLLMSSVSFFTSSMLTATTAWLPLRACNLAR